MPVFEYKALNGNGKNVSNIIDADTPRDAREKLRLKRIYVTEIAEVRGSATKREVVKDELGKSTVVVSTDLPAIVTYTGWAVLVSALLMAVQHMMLRFGKQTILIDGVLVEQTVTVTKTIVVVLSVAATVMFGQAIMKGRSWALWVVAVFAIIEFIGPFSKMMSENDFLSGAVALAWAAVGILCVLSYAKMKDIGADEGTDKIQNLREVSSFTRQLATLLHSGIPLAQALSACIEQADAPGLQKVLRHLREQVSAGNDFGNALETCPGYFNALYINMVRAGQASGQLDDVLTRIADYLASQNRIRNKVINAMMYPAIMGIIGVLVVIILMTFVVPEITRILVEQEIPMPLPTQILVFISDLMSNYWEIMIKVPIVGWFFLQAALDKDAFRIKWDRWKLKLPLFGDLLKKTAVSRFAITFAVLLRSGMPALEALKIVKKIVGNKALQEVIGGIHDSIIEGTDISTPVKKSGVFPPVVGYMIAVGEQTGELETLLERIASAYDEEVDISIQRLTGLIEPIMIVLMAVIVGGIVSAVIIPMLQMSSGGGM